MKKYILISFFAIFATLIIFVAGGLVWLKNELRAPSSIPDKKQVLITKGSSAEKIARVLYEGNIIKNEFVFRLYVRVYNLQGSLPPGQFSIAQNLPVPEVIATLLKGPNEVWVTIPEGLRREQIPSRFTSALNLSETDATLFENTFLTLSKSDEGYLFPETYLVPIDVTAQKSVSILKDTFNKKFGNSFTGSKLELQRTVILASIIERETRTDEEKPEISGILHNRIKVGMPLQVDATVQYALANIRCIKSSDCDWWKTVYLDDYKLNSPFNTYVIAGLPPSPISNPGLASLKAAWEPAVNDYYYYLHDKSGLIHYARTLTEHNANVQRYIR